MNQLKKNLKAVAKDLKKLTEKAEKMIKQLGKPEKARAAKKPKPKPKPKAKAKAPRKAVAKKATRVSASETVLSAIKNSRKGVNTVALRKKTGFEGRKIGDIIYRLKKEGKIKSERKGIYVKA